MEGSVRNARNVPDQLDGYTTGRQSMKYFHVPQKNSKNFEIEPRLFSSTLLSTGMFIVAIHAIKSYNPTLS